MAYIASKDIVCIEDHHQAYYVWKKRGLKDLCLVHLDAHMDFAFQEIKDPVDVLKHARSIAEVRTQVERLLFFRKLGFKENTLVTIGNYIFHAMREGIVGEFYWVVPGTRFEFRENARIIQKIVRDVKRQDPFASRKVSCAHNFVKTTLYGKPFSICSLDSLPRMSREVLLDIEIGRAHV